jgi:hypothetical protein
VRRARLLAAAPRRVRGMAGGPAGHGPIARCRRLVGRRLGAVHATAPALVADARRAGLSRGVGRGGGGGRGCGSVGGDRSDLAHVMLHLGPRSGSAAAGLAAITPAIRVTACIECARIKGGESSRRVAVEKGMRFARSSDPRRRHDRHSSVPRSP